MTGGYVFTRVSLLTGGIPIQPNGGRGVSHLWIGGTPPSPIGGGVTPIQPARGCPNLAWRGHPLSRDGGIPIRLDGGTPPTTETVHHSEYLLRGRRYASFYVHAGGLSYLSSYRQRFFLCVALACPFKS